MPIQLPQLALPALPALPRLPSARTLAHGLAITAAGAFLLLLVWALGPANLWSALLTAASREAAVFMGMIGGVIGVALFASATALLKGRPGWSIGFAVLPLLVLLLLLTH